MKLLVVEGNTKEIRKERSAFGIKPYHEMFTEMLFFLEPNAQVDSAFPTEGSSELPSIEQLQSYDGVLITGSSLSVLENTPAVICQLDFIDKVFSSGVPIYGSCWGLQVATVVAGGKVAKSNNGLELGVSKPIVLTKEGEKSTYFNRKKPFEALCIHYDEIKVVPKDAIVLATNRHSKVQALQFKYKNSLFFGVQYHPEFIPSVMARIICFLKDTLILKGHYSDNKKAQEEISVLESGNLATEIINYKLHTQEIKNWLKSIVKI
jgi:GMP synthase (glutamine-hydrolysing)